jgi:VWFA-related protein
MRSPLLLISLLISLAVLAQAAPQREPFRTGIELVTVDVIVTDRQGTPVRGLTRADFELREDGKPVVIDSFEAVELPEAEPAAPSAFPPAASGSVVHDNLRALEGAIYLIILDVPTSPTARFQRGRKAALALIDQLGPTDQAAMMSMHGQKAYQVEFTTDRSRLTKALERLVVGGQTMESLPDLIERVARQLGPIPSRRKVVALISEGFYFDPEKPEYQLALEAARRANLAIYAFDPKFVGSIDGMVHAESVDDAALARKADRDSVAGLQILAANTGGRATVRTNFLAEGVRQMIADNRSYYLLRYYSPAPQDGKFHEIRVTTRRPGLEVRARPGYTAAKPGGRDTKRDAASVPPLARIAGAPIQSHGLDMRVAALPLPSAAKTGAALVVMTELRGADLAGADSVEMAALAVSMSGQVRAREEYTASVGPVDRADRWMRIASRLEVPPGRYQLRVAARRADGMRQGSVFVEVEVPDFSRTLSPGGLVLALSGPGGVARAERLGNVLPAVPMATLDLPTGLQIAAVMPLRVQARHRASRIQVVAQITGPDGVTHDLLRKAVGAEGFTSPSGGVVHVPMQVPTGASGEHRLRVEVTLGANTYRRELTFRVEAR